MGVREWGLRFIKIDCGATILVAHLQRTGRLEAYPVQILLIAASGVVCLL